jgi:hypothetical protein
MGTRHWTQSYADIPAEIDADRYASMVDLLDAALKRHASRPAFKGVRPDLELRRRRPAVALVRVLPADQAGRTPGATASR